MTQYGYRFGMLASGAGALYLSDHMPWSAVYAIEAALLSIGMVTVLFAREPAARRRRAAAAEPAVGAEMRGRSLRRLPEAAVVGC